MHWWAWLLIGWALLAVLMAAQVGAAIRMSEDRDWVRRGRPERRGAERSMSAPGTPYVPPPRAATRQTRAVMEQSGP
jgi:hypothetical protein